MALAASPARPLLVENARLEIPTDDRGGVFFVGSFYLANSMLCENSSSADHSAVSQVSLDFNRFPVIF